MTAPLPLRKGNVVLFNTGWLELIDSRALVRDKAREFLFVLGQPLYVGSTQVNIDPVAIR
ncbi:hypothetical protein CUJ89_36060 [Burkholderia pyrrocinia]|uniref:Uncharacterized protein n=1 Tax=Burkholderia pyrrocinia TaxID=60550 RepID=A0A2Z5N8H0_BURPY|nr:hypothetical protein [Burkholderia pyrrocinia]AXF25825.1 hypothetical protein CUJ89_36060 [Burkholderia pyrrocinia]